MIDPKLRAQDLADDFLDVNTKASEIVFKLEDLIREAQEDGAAKYKDALRRILSEFTSWTIDYDPDMDHYYIEDMAEIARKALEGSES